MGRSRWFAASGVAVALVLLGGCTQKSLEPFRDAPTAGHDNTPARIIEMPDVFGNLASKCDGPNRIYSAYHGDANRTALAVVANDPRCK